MKKGTDDPGEGLLQAGVNSTGSDGAPTTDVDAATSRTQAPRTSGHWGGNHFTRLYIFEADAPTATTQRLTGLATGSMPSFFSDLHTVDNGVKAEMPKEFAKSDWSFLVGHALGVDHVGHGDVLDSEFMWKKLTEVNDMLKTMTKMILKDAKGTTAATPLQTLFLFFGDHGMTEAGGHGGGSSEENHGALSDINGRRRVSSDVNTRSSSPTPTLGYGSRRVRQVGLAPTLSLLMGLPIPFNSMGQVIADLVPTLSSFVGECAQHLVRVSAASNGCGHGEGKPCIGKPEAAGSIAPTVRCSDLAYLTQLHHIAAWQQYRAIKAHATVTGNDSVLTDPRFEAAKAHWLNLYSALDKEIKALPPEAHIQLVQDVTYFDSLAGNGTLDQTLPLGSAESSEDELLYTLRRHRADGASSIVDGTSGEDSASRANDAHTARLSSALPSLVPYLSAAADFSQEAFLASVRQFGTFNMQLMWCGVFMTLGSFVILLCASLLLSNSSESFTRGKPQTQTERGLPKIATFIWWLSISAGVGSLIWLGAWACCEAVKALQLSPSAATDVILWRQLPLASLTSASCFLVLLFVRRTLRRIPCQVSLKMFSGLLQGEEEPLVEERQSGGRSAAVWPEEICLSRLCLSLFGGGRLLCYSSLFALCVVPFNDCLVNRECAIVNFIAVVYCMSAGLATFGTSCGGGEKTRIVFAWATLVLCFRLGTAFDLAENTSEGEGVARQALQIDTVSSAVLFMFCVFLVVGKERLPLIPRVFGQKSDNICDDAGFARFRVLGFRPLLKRGWRPCIMEHIVFLVQGSLVLLWFATPQDSKSQQSASQESRHSPALHNSFLHDCVAWLWGVAVLPFAAIDSAGSTWLAPLKHWTVSAPPSLLGALPAQLKEGKQVKFLEALHIFLPWLVFAMTGGLWLRLVLVLCRMEKRENKISTIQLRRIEAELTNMEDELAHRNERTHLAHRSGSKLAFFHSWRIEFWDYFAYYLLLTTMCPLCMYAMLLGRSQLWPLLLCCVKWRLLYLSSRIIVFPAPRAEEKQSGSAACGCCFCRARAAAMSCEATVSRLGKRASSVGNVGTLQGKKRFRFFLSDSSICMLAGLLALDTFFATGHRMKLSAVPVEAGFIGLLEFHPVWSVVTSFFHTYLSYMICCPFIFMLIFSRLAHLASAAADFRGSNEGEELKASTADTVVQKTLLITAKVAFRCAFSYLDTLYADGCPQARRLAVLQC
ncbi:hypothetical protein Emag_004925 [Eimeria magna]